MTDPGSFSIKEMINMNKDLHNDPLWSRIDAVLFDLDGTLIDTEKYYQEAWKEAGAHFGLDLGLDKSLQLRSLGKPFARQQFREWFGDEPDIEVVRAYRRQLSDKLIEERGLDLKPGAAELLTWLKNNNIRICLVTASLLDRANKLLDKAGILDMFDDVISAEMVEQGKPAPDVYLHACSRLGISPERTIAVEDSPNGVKSAYRAGCNVVMVPDLTPPDEEINSMLYACAETLGNLVG